MSKEIIEVNIHYGQEDFKKLFEGLVKSTIASQELPYKSNNELRCSAHIAEIPCAKESSEGEQRR